MDKGIRPAANAKFLELIPTRVKTREGNTAFRKTVIAFIMEQFGATLASAATHYNHAFIDARKKAETDTVLAEQLEGLGRPEDKKGGRKPKAQPAPAGVIPVPVNALLQNFINAGVVPGAQPAPAAQITAAAAAVGLEGLGEETGSEDSSEDAPQGDEAAPQLFSVYKVAKGTMVAEGLTREQADELVAKAAAAKKAKLEVR